jgi:heat-inducible transcriptional repressor
MTPRRAEVLRLVVHEYVDSATPVGSQTLVRKYNLRLSPATIRNELASLERENYVTHPHTSAGRVPSDRGYRYFVESLMVEEDLSPEEKATIRHQFYQASRELEEWSELAASILSRAAGSLALVTAPHAPQSRLKHVELIELNERTVLMVVVLQEARVRQRLLTIEAPLGQAKLTEISGRLNSACAGQSKAELNKTLASPDLAEAAEDSFFLQAICDIMAGEDRSHQPHTFTDGLENVLAEPEFARSERALDVLGAVDQRNLARVIPFQSLREGRVLVMIGGENLEDSMREFSVVASPYGLLDESRGALGVVGPTRMHYSRVISTVRYMSEVMSDLLSGLQADQDTSHIGDGR